MYRLKSKNKNMSSGYCCYQLVTVYIYLYSIIWFNWIVWLMEFFIKN